MLQVSPDAFRERPPITLRATGPRSGQTQAALLRSLVADLVTDGTLWGDALARTEIGYGTEKRGVAFAIAKVLGDPSSGMHGLFKPPSAPSVCSSMLRRLAIVRSPGKR